MTPTWSGFLPADESDRRLLAETHPEPWPEPTPKARYDLVVVGAGTAGLVTAAGAAGLGATVALVEGSLMGGDCLVTGCVPSKAILAGARGRYGDFAAVMARMRRIRADLSVADGAPRFAGLGVDVFFGQGRFAATDRLLVNGRTLRFHRAVIATGARPLVPPIVGLDEVGYFTNETIFSLTELPRRLVVIGAGPIGCELAQAFVRLGSAVTLLEVGTRILPKDDPDAAAIVQRALVREGVTLQLGMRIDAVERDGESRVVRGARDGAEVRAAGDALLLATGRAPNLDGLGLEAAGVRFDRRGVTVDHRLRTSNSRIFAAGDVCSSFQFTHSADFQARLVIANALFFGRRRHSRLVVPWCTYTSPELAHVGITPEEAAARGVALDTITVPFDSVDRAVLDGETQGFLRVHLRRGSDRLLGATIVGEHAGELIAEASAAMTNGHGLSDLGRAIRPYPTRAEAYRKASDARGRARLTPMVRRLLAFWFRLFRH